MRITEVDIDDRTKKALFRLEVIAPLVSWQGSKHELAAERKRVLQRVYKTPDDLDWRISERTLRKWLSCYRQKGFAGLFDADRGTHGRCRAISEAVLQEAVALRKVESSLSIPQLQELLKYSEKLKADEIENLSPSTLNRHLNKRGIYKNKAREEIGTFQRWQQKFVNDLWMADTCDGIWLPDPSNPKRIKKTYLISFIDDASRLIPHAQFYWDTQLPSLLDCFRKALLKRGKPERLYADNAWIYHSTTMRLLCAELDITPSFCTAKRPPGKGKIERKQRTDQDGFFKIAEHADIKTLDELNQFYFAWLTSKYHKVVHSELNGLTPLQRWLVDKERIIRVTPLELRRGLMLRCDSRKVNRKTSTVRMDNTHYQASVALADQTVEVRYHFNDTSEIEIWQRGKFIEIAKPVIVGANIDFKKWTGKKEEDSQRGKPHATFKRYRLALVANKAPQPSLNIPASELITQQELITLFTEQLGRELSESDHDFIVKFFLKHAPFDRTAVRAGLEQTIEAAGAQLHMRAYCERLLDTITRR
jgi:transposase InsO family protein